MLKKVLIGLIGLVVAFVGVGLFLPSEYMASRSIEIAAPSHVIFDLVDDLKKNEQWSPWIKADPTMKLTFGDKTKGEGATYDWTSENSGDGTITILKSVPHTSIENALDFKSQGKGTGSWTFAESGDQVKVTWSMKGDAGSNIVGRYFGLVIDSMVGSQFEAGLADLKKISESTKTSTTTP